jgi:pyruvate formate lyase activating enzyme
MPPTGMVFDIQRFSLNDGPGIRTTVFLKGCVLDCRWCHNPESKAPAPQILFNPVKCVLCRACAAACPRNGHRFDRKGHQVDFRGCTSCGRCVKACLHGALRIVGAPLTIASVMKEVLADRAYYARSGGGITLSGGEPMLQFEFSLALLAKAKACRIHTAIETCGAASPERYRRIARVTDLFLFDWKATDPGEHMKLTGADNALIRKNLDSLYRMGKPIILRCPLIPGVNDTGAHLAGIAALSRKYPKLKGIELMAYHDLGTSKNRNIGRIPVLARLKTADEKVKKRWLARLAKFGCTTARFG